MKNNNNKKLILFLLIIFFSFLFFIVNEKDTEKESKINKDSNKEKLEISVVGVLEGQESTLFMDVGKDKGFFDNNNLAVSWEPLARGISTVMISGKMDVAFSGATRSILAFSEGADTRIIAVPFKAYTVALSRFPKEEASKIKIVAINDLTGEPMMYAYAALKTYGVDPNEVEFITITDSISRQRMLEKGTVDFAMTRNEYLKDLKDPENYYIISSEEYLKNSNAVQGILTTEKKILEKPESLKKFVKSIYEISNFIVANPEEIKNYSKEKYSLNDDDSENLSKRMINMIKMNSFIPSEETIQSLFNEISEVSNTDIEKPAKDFIYDDFAKEVTE